MTATRFARTVFFCLLGFTLSAVSQVSHAQVQNELHVSNFNSGTIVKVKANGTVHPFAANIPSAAQLVFNQAGNLYVGTGDFGGGAVYQVTPNGTVTVFVSGLGWPTGIAIRQNILSVSSAYYDSVYHVTLDGTVSFFAEGLDSTPQYVTFDQAGNLYTSNNIYGTIDKITPDGQVSVFASGLNRPEQLVFDRKGRYLYVAERLSNSIVRISSDGAVHPFVSGKISNPIGLALSPNGDFYVGSFQNQTTAPVIFQVSPSGQVKPFAASYKLFNGVNGLTFGP